MRVSPFSWRDRYPLTAAVGQEIENKLASHLNEELGSVDLVQVESETLLVKGKSNVYAGGDIIRGAGTVVESVADGRRAARAIHAKLIN